MTPWYVAVVMGIVEGLTEFLPISSTGHLILAGHLMGFTGPKADTFSVAIQLGAIMAVVVLYREKILALFRPAAGRRFAGGRGLTLLFLTTLPALVAGYLAHASIKALLFGPHTVALALAVGAVMIFIVEARRKRPRIFELDAMTPATAVCIGLFQCLALWPGFSRAGATIMGAMLCGVERKTAAEYSFLAAVPLMFAATGYDMLKNYRLFDAGDLGVLAIGFVVSFVSAWAAVKGFIYLLGRVNLLPFAIYRLLLAPLAFFLWPE